MAKSVSKIINQVHQLAEEIESINVNDSDGWRQICRQLEAIIAGFPKKRADSIELFSLCLEGLKAVADKNTDHMVALIDTVTDIFYTAESILKDGPDRGDRIAEAQTAITRVLAGQQPQAQVDERGDGQPLNQLTLNDIAAMLIQIEPNDNQGLQVLYDRLDDLGGTQDFPEKSVSDRSDLINIFAKRLLRFGSTPYRQGIKNIIFIVGVKNSGLHFPELV